MIEESKINKLKELIENFQFNLKQYKSNIYDEANTRVDFVGWDLRKNGKSGEVSETYWILFVEEDDIYLT